jgi:transposase InsO family protein
MTNNDSKAFFKNESLQQYNAFKIKVATASRKGDAKTNGADTALRKDARPTAADAVAEFKKQNLALFDVIVDLTDHTSEFMETLSTRFNEDGWGAMQYLKEWWANDTNEGRTSDAAATYKQLAGAKLPPNTTGKEMTAHLNKLLMMQTSLKRTEREVSDAAFALDIKDLIARMGKDYDSELRTTAIEKRWDKTHWQDPSKLIHIAEVVVDKLHKYRQPPTREHEAPAPRPDQVDTEGLRALISALEQGRPKFGACGLCGVPHKGNDDKKQCHAWLLSEDKTPPGWDGKPDDQKERIQKRADAIKEHGPYKDRAANRAGGAKAGNTMASLALLLGALPGMRTATVPTSTRLLIDSQTIARDGGVQYHLISSERHFLSIDKTAASVPIGPAGKYTPPLMSRGVGDCAYLTSTGETMVLSPCLLVPDLGHNLVNVKRCEQMGVLPDFQNGVLQFPSGQRLPFDNKDYSLAVTPLRDIIEPGYDEGILALANVITRGKQGPMHVDTANLNVKQQEELAAWCKRLGTPPAAVLNKLHTLVQGAPAVLRKANDANVASDATMLATARKMPAPSNKYPVATKAGERTARDWWAAKTTSRINGCTGYFTYIDIGTSHFRVYPRASKADVDLVDRRYMAEAKRDGVDVELGGVLYSDNEQIFIAKHVQDNADAAGLVLEYSNPYEPWQNGAAEVVHRYHPHYMRKAAIQGNLPGGDFFPFLALWAEDVLNAIREREGQSCYAKWHGKQFDISILRPPGCFAAVNMPLSWRGHKIEQQNVAAIYLCRSRNRPGSTFWSPTYGLLYSTQFTCNESRFPFRDDGWTVDSANYDDDYVPTGRDVGMQDDADIHTDDDEGSDTTPDDDDGDDDMDAEGEQDAPRNPRGWETEVDDEDDDEVRFGDDRIDDDSAAAPTAEPPRRNRTIAVSSSDTEERESDEEPVQPQARMSARSSSGGLPQSVFGYAQLEAADPDASGMRANMAHTLADAATMHYAAVCGELDRRDNMRCMKAGIPGPFAHRSALPPEFAEADRLEINGILYDHRAAIPVPLRKAPTDAHIETCLSVRTVKNDGRHKTRCTINNPAIPKGTRTQSPTIMSASIRSCASCCACMGMNMHFRDFHLAYLNSHLKPDEYMWMWPPTSAPQYDEFGERLVWMVVKALYGAAFSGRKWYDTIRQWLIERDYEPSTADPCVFVKKREGKVVCIIGLYVDDMMIGVHDDSEIDALDAALATDFKVKKVDPTFLSIEFEDTAQFVTLTMKSYIERIAAQVTLTSGAHHTPSSPELADLVKQAVDAKDRGSVDVKMAAEYRRVVGQLNYVATTVRADIAWAVGQLSQALNCPTTGLLQEAYNVLSYLYDTRHLGLRYKKGARFSMFGMSDANWTTRRSTSGYVFFLAGAAISYASKRQVSIAMSSTEAEIMAASLAALEAVFLLALVELCMGAEHGTIDLHVDNSGAVDISKDYVANNRTRHIERRHLKIRELVQRAIIDTKWIATDDNVADIFTKYVGRDKFKKFRNGLLNM